MQNQKDNLENLNGETEKMSGVPIISLTKGDYSDLKLKELALMSSSGSGSETTTTPMGRREKDSNRNQEPSQQMQRSRNPQRRTADDFRFGKSIGEGSFSTVYLAEDIHTRKEYAIKGSIKSICCLYIIHI